MALEQRVSASFDSEEFDKIAPDLFHVVGFDGIEAISVPFRFDIDLISEDPDIDLELLIGKVATLEFSRDEHIRKVHGVISILEQGEETQFDHYSYKAVLVPRLWLMSLSRQNQIYQEKSVPDIFTEEILNGDFPNGLLSDDLDSRLGDYPVREYVVQYKETDLNFISRLMEHEGVYYYFDHEDERDQIIICDDRNQLDALKSENTVSYVPASGLASFEEEAIHTFRLKQTHISSEIILKDFNYRQPHLPLQGNSDTCELGHGRLSDYGDHFKDPEEGDKLARIRAQEELGRQKTCVGTSDAILFEAGKLIEMLDHYRDDLNREYLITRIRHRGGQALPGVSAGGETAEAIAYLNDFDAIPSDIEFRPARKTVKPKLYGIMSATVDGAENTNRAQIDEQGRYKLIMPFDISGSGEGKATRWVRKAESYGGQGTGMHFPLLKGSEVIWTCIDGDLDRPIITGVVPNPLNKSVVSSENHTANKIVTPSGIVMEMNDGKGITTQKKKNSTEQQHSQIKVDSSISAVQHRNVNVSSELIQQQQHVFTAHENETDDLSTEEDETKKWFSIKLPDYRKAADDEYQTSYFRLGAYDNNEQVDTLIGVGPDDPSYEEKTLINAGTAMEIISTVKDKYGLVATSTSGNGLFESTDPARFGIFEYTDGAKLNMHMNGCLDIGNGTSITYDGLGGNDSIVELVIGEVAGENWVIKSEHLHRNILGGWETTSFEYALSRGWTIGDTTEIFMGAQNEYFIGSNFSASTALDAEVFLGGKSEVFAGVATEVKLSAGVELGAGIKYSHMMEDEVNVCEGEWDKNAKKITLQVDPRTADTNKFGNFCAGATAVVVGLGAPIAAVGAQAIEATVAHNNQPTSDVIDIVDKLSPQAILAHAFSGLVALGGAVAYLGHKLKKKADLTLHPKIEMDSDKIVLDAGGPFGAKMELHKTGKILLKGMDVEIAGDQKLKIKSIGSFVELTPSDIAIQSQLDMKITATGKLAMNGLLGGEIKGLKVDLS